ncbi:NADH-quinone oxidoreductase subunit L [Candidatus Hecatella orcuttiae]|uniref:NADH-quinone oxidoreductase subunit 5 family protein n=1 Tax=Candidatus Hecatella orcuttiae TaxID=1935119 RepID=UPI0028682E6E|nr:NADH-quinone oxidoreductase subunit L [Candidatus Hecatella orcuttiae]
MEYTPWLSWVFPILGALLTPALARIHPRVRDYAAVGFSGLGAFMAFLMFLGYPQVLKGEASAGFYPLSVEWIRVAGVQVKAGMLVDPLSVLMANVAAWIGLLIMVYSLGYMRGDPALTRYWFFMNLFIGNMVLLVLADNLLLLFIGWEGVGLCSYALIGFWHRDSPEDRKTRWVGEGAEEYPPSHCGMKAFLTTKVGDIFLLVAIFLIYSQAGTFSFLELQGNLAWARSLAEMGLLIPAALFLLGGPLGKSAQLPLMEWLPDAMAGPASVSALIHAATMVKAGVYLVARVFPIFFSAMHSGLPSLIVFFQAVAWAGALTAFVAATQAVVSREIKKVWAYSTVSQIGYMMLALGIAGFLTGDALVAAFAAALFHLVSHALFKATLFLSSGSVSHACESRFMDDMGGLRRLMPFSFLSMFIGALALAGVPPLSGFWSKEGILKSVVEAFQASAQAPFLYTLAALTVGLTFFYSLRVVGLVFLGGKSAHLQKAEKLGHHVHEAPPLMWIPYLALALITVAIGALAPLLLEGFLSMFSPSLSTLAHLEGGEAMEAHSPLGEWLVLLTSTLMLALGGIPAYYAYVAGRWNVKAWVERRPELKALQVFLLRRWYINQAYYRVFVDPALKLSDRAHRVLEFHGLLRFSSLVASGVTTLYSRLRKTHTGVFNDYAVGLMGGLTLLIVLLVWLGLGG